MKSVLILLVVTCAFSSRYVNAGKHENCEDGFYAMKKEIKMMIDEDTAPECIKELEMDQFKCTAGEDNKKDKELGEKYKQWFEKLDENMKEKVMMCSVELSNAALEGTKGDITEECINKIKEIQAKIMDYIEEK